MINSTFRMVAIDSGNQLLAQLGDEAWQHFEPDLEPVELTRGRTLQEAGAKLQYVYFPTSAVVSLVSSMRDGGSTEVAVVSNEGMVGVCAFMGGGTALSDGVVQTSGHAWRMPAPALASHAARHAAVMLPLLRYAQALFVQLAQASACHRRHTFHQQLCCWLLLQHDHHPGNDLRVTQEHIAELLGVRRETVTAGAVKLQKSGLIRYSRGHIVIQDRKGLEGQSCECYAVVRSAYDRLSDAPLAEPPSAGYRHAVHGCIPLDGGPDTRRRAAAWAA